MIAPRIIYVGRRRMVQLRRAVNAAYRFYRWRGRREPLRNRVFAQATLEAVGSPHVLARDWNVTPAITRVRFVLRGKRRGGCRA